MVFACVFTRCIPKIMKISNQESNQDNIIHLMNPWWGKLGSTFTSGSHTFLSITLWTDLLPLRTPWTQFILGTTVGADDSSVVMVAAVATHTLEDCWGPHPPPPLQVTKLNRNPCGGRAALMSPIGPATSSVDLFLSSHHLPVSQGHTPPPPPLTVF